MGARLRWLRDRWANQLLAASDRVRILTPLNGTDAAAIGFVSIEGLDPAKLQPWLLDKHRIVTTLIVHPEFSGLRITPSVYTTPSEIDTFVDCVRKAMKTGIA